MNNKCYNTVTLQINASVNHDSSALCPSALQDFPLKVEKVSSLALIECRTKLISLNLKINQTPPKLVYTYFFLKKSIN